MSIASAVTVSEARRELASIIDRVRVEHAPIYLARRGRRVAAVIDADDLDQILELAEDMADIRAAAAAPRRDASDWRDADPMGAG